MPKLKRNWPDLRKRSAKGKTIFLSTAFTRLVPKYKRVFQTAYNLLVEHGKTLGKFDSAEDSGVKIQRIWFGAAGGSNLYSRSRSDKESETFGTFLVTYNKARFFAKFKPFNEVKDDIEKLSDFQKFINANNGEINGIKVRTPAVLYAQIGQEHSFYVSEYLDPKRYLLINKLLPQHYEKARNALTVLFIEKYVVY